MMVFGAAHAQDTAVMTLRDCVRYALSHSAEVRVLQADLGDAQLARRNAILNAFTPEIDASTYAYSNFGRSIDPETNIYSTTTSFHNGYSLSAGITLFNGVRAINNKKITKTAAISSVIGGIVLTLILIFVFGAIGVSQAGGEATFGNIFKSGVSFSPLIGVICMIASCIIVIVVSLFTKPLDKEIVDAAFEPKESDI